MNTYLTIEEVLRIHARLIEAFGGAEGVRDLGLVESALLRPQTGYYATIVEEAAALWESLAMNHGFVDGNKQVTYACAEIFLALNGLEIDASNDELEQFIYEHLEAKTFVKEVLQDWLGRHTVPLEP